MDTIERINALLAQEQKKLEALTPEQRVWVETNRIMATDVEFLDHNMQISGICTPSYWIARQLLMTILLSDAIDCAEVPGDVPVFGSSEN